jgi:hypothetical protein
MKEILARIHAVISQDGDLLSLLGGESQIRRSEQGREVEPPCVTLGALSEERFVEGTDRIRNAEVQVSAWAIGDRACSDVSEAVIAALDDADLGDETLHCYACVWRRAGGEPRYDAEAGAYKNELSFKVIYRLK